MGSGSLSDDFYPDDIKSRQWTIRKIAHLWRPRTVRELPHKHTNDFPYVDFFIPTFSGRAVEALREFLEPNGELLPLRCDTGTYYLYNVLTVIDALDHEKSEIDWMGYLSHQTKVVADNILRYEFHAERIANASIFRIVERPVDYYVTQPFVDRVLAAGLQGFNLKKVWPLPWRKKGSLAEMERRAGLALRENPDTRQPKPEKPAMQ